jgi:replicative DNA helicase
MIRNGNKPDAVFIDYLTMISVDNQSEDRMDLKVGSVVKQLKACAKEMDIPFVVASQLSRGKDESNRPVIKSLKESSIIEDTADIILMLHREEFYKGAQCKDDLKGRIEVIIGKCRNGPTGELVMTWNGEYTRISE